MPIYSVSAPLWSGLVPKPYWRQDKKMPRQLAWKPWFLLTASLPSSYPNTRNATPRRKNLSRILLIDGWMTHGGSGSSTGLNNAPSLIVLHVLYTASIRPWYLGHQARAVMKFMIVLTAGALHSSNGSTSDVRDFNGECKLLMIRLWLITLRITVILSCLAFAQDSKHAGAPED